MFGKKQNSDNLPVSASAKRSNALTVTKGASLETLKRKNAQIFTAENPDFSRQSVNHGQKADLSFTDAKLRTAEFFEAKSQLTEILMEKIDFSTLENFPDDVKKERVREAATQVINSDIHIPLTALQIKLLKEQAVDDLLGFGPIEVLMADPDVADIMINSHRQVYIEKQGKVMLTDIVFGSEKHLLNVIQKIVSIVGRRVDESSPMVDARMPDGSRFNAIIPPLALDGCLVSIRKFKKQKIALHDYIELGSISPQMCDFLMICGNIRLNILISGGTGSGKTTLLNALSGSIDHRERVITIEDAAELQLQQPHVLRMETRPPNMEGVGEINQRQLVKNALRMRPDRIIIGEIRGDEVIDVLTAMNTGHDGSMATIHANTPRDALSRIENLVGMSAVKLSLPSLRTQIASAVQLVIQIARQRDGRRRITQIDEIVGVEGEAIVTRALFGFRPGPMGDDGVLTGTYYSTGLTPHFLTQAAYFGREEELLACLKAT